LDTATLALIVGALGALGGGLGAKVIDYLYNTKKSNVDFAALIRSEQRSELTELRLINTQLKEKIEDLTLKYYDALQKNVELEKLIGELQIRITTLEDNIPPKHKIKPSPEA